MKKLFIVTLVLALGQAAEGFDFHTIRKPAAAAIEGVVEGEFLKASGATCF